MGIFKHWALRSTSFESADCELAMAACARGSKKDIGESLRRAEGAQSALARRAYANFVAAGMCARSAIAMGALWCVGPSAGLGWGLFAAAYCALAAWAWARQRDRYGLGSAAWRIWMPEPAHALHAAAALAVLANVGGLGAAWFAALCALAAQWWVAERSRRYRPLALAWGRAKADKRAYALARLSESACREALSSRAAEWACQEEAIEIGACSRATEAPARLGASARL